MPDDDIAWDSDVQDVAQPSIVCASVDQARDRYAIIFGRRDDLRALSLPSRFGRHFDNHPYDLPDRNTVAVHEAGHFLADEVEGFGAYKAAIFGPRFGRGGWRGHAQPFDGSCYEGPPECQDAHKLLRDARATLAGPVAEEIVGSASALNNISELFEARMIVARAARLIGANKSTLWKETVAQSTLMVEFYREEILAIADVLERRKQIFSHQPSIRKFSSACRADSFREQQFPRAVLP